MKASRRQPHPDPLAAPPGPSPTPSLDIEEHYGGRAIQVAHSMWRTDL